MKAKRRWVATFGKNKVSAFSGLTFSSEREGKARVGIVLHRADALLTVTVVDLTLLISTPYRHFDVPILGRVLPNIALCNGMLRWTRPSVRVLDGSRKLYGQLRYVHVLHYTS